MKLIGKSAIESLNKANYKQPVGETELATFEKNVRTMLSSLNVNESEEHNKTALRDFLLQTFYAPTYAINTRERDDLVIHHESSSDSDVAVIIETKRPKKKGEMVSLEKPNVKALHELVYYYLEERINRNQHRIKQLIATDGYEWYIFDEVWFEKNIYRNAKLKKDYEEHKVSGNDTKHFYENIAAPCLETIEPPTCTYINLETTYGNKKPNTKEVKAHYKIFTPEHLLKKPLTNDSNTLNKEFYYELLYILGLEEKKEGGKKLITRADKNRYDGTLLENTIQKLQTSGKLRNVADLATFGDTEEQQLFSVGLELCINWLNRILFLKLLEGQLKTYHKAASVPVANVAFLNSQRIRDYGELNELFFEVLAVPVDKRSATSDKRYGTIPYLNSSLFEPSDLELATIDIAGLNSRAEMPLYSHTILKDAMLKKQTAVMGTLEYLFAFLDAYDFGSDENDEVQRSSRPIINAAVLGLIFEKINGYKDGSFYTPGFITMYMSRETLRRAVVQKFNERKGWDCENLIAVSNQITKSKTSLTTANEIVNSLRICDPAVGSGHFLVSVLNELIVIKQELGILADKNGRLLRYDMSIERDELVIMDKFDFYQYNYANNESQLIQETLFHEKQTIIEQCLYGVDINPKSVMICRLRLWIELLKNAYYIDPKAKRPELQTLPNIDINIKCGNSLISRFALDEDLSEVFRKQKFTRQTYLSAVESYKNAKTKGEKEELRTFIKTIKENFRTSVLNNNPIQKKLNLKKGELIATDHVNLFGKRRVDDEQIELMKRRLTKEIAELEIQLDDYRNSTIYKHAFEWRFEFPEVMNEAGDYVGFDVVIGNPPYGVKANQTEKAYYSQNYKTVDDVYTVFTERGLSILSENASLSYINPIFWLTGSNYIKTREYIAQYAHLELAITLPYNVFADAYVDTGIYIFKNKKNDAPSKVYEFKPRESISKDILYSITLNDLPKSEWMCNEDLNIILNTPARLLQYKVSSYKSSIEEYTVSIRGILAKTTDYSESPKSKSYKKIFTGKIDRYDIENTFSYVRYGENLTEKPNDYNFFCGERILIRRIISRKFRIMATINNEEFVTKKDVYIFKTKVNGISPLFLLGLINSKLISFLKTTSTNSAKKDDFTQLTLNDIRSIKFPYPSKKIESKFSSLVDKILAAKKADSKADTVAWEEEIDRLVYKLYDLTEEEIKVVEGI